MSYDDDEDDDTSFEHTLLVVREVSVYKIPPRSTSGGFKCGDWLHSDKIWSGRLRVVASNHLCHIRLEDPSSGDLFASSSLSPGSVEPALDSSRYFLLKIDDGNGKHAFVGLGFAERNEAFDFNVALSDHDKYVKREIHNESPPPPEIGIHPSVNHRLKEGETIRITVKHKPASGSGMLSAAGLSGGNSNHVSPKPLGLAPPPTGTGKILSPLPPPPNDPATAKLTLGPKGSDESGRHARDPLSDFSELERNLPSAADSGSSKSAAAGWAAF